MLNSTVIVTNAHSDGHEAETARVVQKGSGKGLERRTGQELESLANAVERMVALGIGTHARVYVDDEDRLPSYARHVGTAWSGQELDDQELDYAIGWLPSEAFLNDDSPWPGSYNPYITIDHLHTIGDVK
ncbi:hypothetical protein MycrhDRAFT_5454 [Mycolicibacterium rhodesiae JS60]|nr:hypothetical protein MycrhDRAFT_5454 [Mycolicibacterium rhodesiae JS60]